jgi:hypothetical protein
MDIVTEELRWTSNKDFAAFVASGCALSHMRVHLVQWCCPGSARGVLTLLEIYVYIYIYLVSIIIN